VFLKFWRYAAPFLLVLACTGALADDAPSPVDEKLTPLRLGYAFDQPDILLRQRIFGFAHGALLLVSACLDRDAHAEATQNAYDFWHASQREAIEQARRVVAAYHFGVQADRAQWQDIARALGLKETIFPSLGDVPLPEACATLPQALMQARYDFATQLELANDPAAR
jgi:hypothetical protein